MSDALHLSSEARSFYEASNPIYNRGLDSYEQLFRCRIEKLFGGGRILDLGAGARAAFARDLASTDITVVSLSPNSGTRKELTPRPEHLPVSGLAQQLPFASNSFDGVLASWSVPMYLPKSVDHHRALFGEVHRVLGPDGIAMFGPLSDRTPLVNRALAADFDWSVYRLGHPGTGRVLMLAKHAGVFDRPELKEVCENIADKTWSDRNPLMSIPHHFYDGLGERTGQRSWYVQGSLRIGKVMIRDDVL